MENYKDIFITEVIPAGDTVIVKYILNSELNEMTFIYSDNSGRIMVHSDGKDNGDKALTHAIVNKLVDYYMEVIF